MKIKDRAEGKGWGRRCSADPRPGPGAAWSRACRWAGCRLPSPAPPPPARPGPPASSAASHTKLLSRTRGSTSAAPEVWLTPLRKQTAPGPAGAAGHRGWIPSLPAGGRRQTDLGSQQPWGEGWARTAAGWGGGRGAPVTWATLDNTLVSGSLSAPGELCVD